MSVEKMLIYFFYLFTFYRTIVVIKVRGHCSALYPKNMFVFKIIQILTRGFHIHLKYLHNLWPPTDIEHPFIQSSSFPHL